MSRIYDALRRANLERRTHASMNMELVSDPVYLPEFDEPSPIPPDLTENVTTNAWEPVMASLPTLQQSGVTVEQFRALRTRIYALRESKSLKSILVCSSTPEEGKTFVTANLAISLARNCDNRVLLIDADLRRPSLHALLGAPETPGLADFLDGSAQVREILQQGKIPVNPESTHSAALSNLTFIPSGKRDENSPELVTSERMDELFRPLAPFFDWILIDSAPVLGASDAVQMAHSVDAVLLVVRYGRTPYELAKRAQAALDGAPIIGVVLNDGRDSSRESISHYDYQYLSDSNNRASSRS